MLASRNSKDMSPIKNSNSSAIGSDSDKSDDERAPIQRIKKRLHRFSDSDTEKENVEDNCNKQAQCDNLSNKSDSESESSCIPFKSGGKKSRIKMGGSSSDSDTSRQETTKNTEQQMRMKNKRNKLKDKFKGLLSSREKPSTPKDKSSDSSHEEMSDNSDYEISSIAKIKQKIKKSMASVSSICDPDTSDEDNHKKEVHKEKQKKQQKSTKLIEPKPMRMSAKQAMENMQLIKSESNRMLREKAVSLPYHRPKALSLKDIMSKRKPAVTSDGKALPIKMNEEQLKHYALLLEQRQKEMMELCKSESDEETPDVQENIDELHQGTANNSDMKSVKNEIVSENTNITVENKESENNDSPMDVGTDVPTTTEIVQNILVETVSTEVIPNSEVNNENQVESTNIDPNNKGNDTDQNDSHSDFKLVYNDSVEEGNVMADAASEVPKEDAIHHETSNNGEERNNSEIEAQQQNTKVSSEQESQLISLHYNENNTEELEKNDKLEDVSNEILEEMDTVTEDKQDDFFSDDDVNMDDIDKIIENAEIMKDNENISSPMLIKEPLPLNAKPTLTGAPGMVIDLDGGTFVPKKLTGVELLKERFTYFARIKTPEELEREKEKKLKPGAQHLKLKQELEEKIAEQRSLEWAKRLEEEKQQHKEMETILDDSEDSLEKIKDLENDGAKEDESSSENEEDELEENDIEIKDKPRKTNPMMDDEAEESDCGENPTEVEPTDVEEDDNQDDDEQDDNEDDDSSDDESSESEEETTKPKKGRILKAFEDSDDEEPSKSNDTETLFENIKEKTDVDAVVIPSETQVASQDDVIQLAQRHQSASDDLFTSQESSTVIGKNRDEHSAHDEVLGTQTFSILDSTNMTEFNMDLKSPSKLQALCISQPYHDPNLNAIVDGSQLPITQTSQSQPIGEDILALCTGKFYDNEFVSQTDENEYVDDISQDIIINNELTDTQSVKTAPTDEIAKEINDVSEKQVNIKENEELAESTYKDTTQTQISKERSSADGNILKSLLDELDDPEFDKPKPNKFFTGGNTLNKEKKEDIDSTQMKKKFIIESDDETTETYTEELTKKKKFKRKKPEKRALHISDDEEEEDDLEQEEEYMSDLEDETERLVEYDSEENEIEVQPDKPKKKRKTTDFFEQEAELTSEDEWVGSGDEDEKGLDRMEREAGDDDVFHQGKLRRELGQIHMRDVLDQDKREVRLIQELLFEDGDLGGGHRQRKFRWRNADEGDETGTVPDEFADTQEEEFESEEQWRKQRHEREVFLRQMHQDEDDGSINVSVSRTTIIKANLSSKSMSTLLQEVNQSKTENADSAVVQEKKIAKDIPSPKKAFSIFQQNYHGSLLTRGRGALARLAALATPLAADDDAPKIGSLTSHKRNFVFAALTPDEDAPKVTIKRKADVNLGTPKLVKKMKIEEKQARPKSSLLDHLNL